MTKNFKLILIISVFNFFLVACTGGSGGGGGSARTIPMTTEKIAIPGNYIPTLSSTLFFAPAISSASTDLFIAYGSTQTNIQRSSPNQRQYNDKFKPKASDEPFVFTTFNIPATITPLDQTIDIANNIITISATNIAINNQNLLRNEFGLVLAGITNLNSNAATFLSTAIFSFDGKNHTAFYSAGLRFNLNQPSKTKLAASVAAAGTIGGVTDLWLAEAVESGSIAPSPTPAHLNGSPCAPNSNTTPTALNNFPEATVPTFAVGTANGNICSYNVQQQQWALLTNNTQGYVPTNDAIAAVQVVAAGAATPSVFFQTSSGRIFTGKIGTVSSIPVATALTSLPGAPAVSSINTGTMYADEFGDVFVGGKDALGKTVVYAFNSYNYQWETILLEQSSGVPEIAPVTSILPSIQGTIVIGTSTNADMTISAIYELI